MTPSLSVKLVLLALLIGGCDSLTVQSDVSTVPEPRLLDPALFGDESASNRWYPLLPGTVWTYQDLHTDHQHRIEVTPATRLMGNIEAQVTRRRTWSGDELVSDSYTWLATDHRGTVWRLGEDVTLLEDEQMASKRGSWASGMGGARPGIMMWQKPVVGSVYYEAFAPGSIERVTEILATGVSWRHEESVYNDCVRTRSTSRLRSGWAQDSVVCPGVGMVATLSTEGDPISVLTGFGRDLPSRGAIY